MNGVMRSDLRIDGMRKTFNPYCRGFGLTRAFCLAVLLVFGWFSAQAPVSPALSAMAARDMPAGRTTPTSGPVAEDLSNAPLKEHLSLHRRADCGGSGGGKRERPRFALLDVGAGRGVAQRGFAASRGANRDLLAQHCILRT